MLTAARSFQAAQQLRCLLGLRSLKVHGPYNKSITHPENSISASLCMQGTTTVTGEYANPRIADLDLDPSPSVVADGVSTSILAPLCILHKVTAGQLATSGVRAG